MNSCQPNDCLYPNCKCSAPPMQTNFENLNTAAAEKSISRCRYEAWVEEYFGLKGTPAESEKIDCDYGQLVNLLATFDNERQ